MGEMRLPPDLARDVARMQRRLDVLERRAARGAPVIDFQQDRGESAAYYAFGNGTNVTVDAAQVTLLSLTYTPPVDVWWQVDAHVSLVQKLDAAWHYTQLAMHLSVADEFGTSIVYGDTASCHNAMPFTALHGSRAFALAAGVTYQVYCSFTANGGSWQFYKAPNYLWMEGTARPR